ncbi:MAG TPA: FKBP-type peptidyl-prolyl cis-trans isomerase [Phycisphaerales bacterium]|mgnify:CR=1 FL=1|nr:FKBP-type peptidyl-prolyl cis-trans isomerase [Phycisphaerales bacterium]
MPQHSNPAGQRLLGKSIALVALTALLAYGCERGKENAAPPPRPIPAADAPATPAAPPAAKPTDPPHPAPAPDGAASDAGDTPKPPIPHTELAKDHKPLSETTTPRGVIVQTMKEGAGLPTFPKALVTLHFVMYVKDGWKKIESTYESGEPFVEQRLDNFVPGLGEGVVGMKPGEVRRIIVPPALAFGHEGLTEKDGTVVVGPDATIVFDAELISAKQAFIDPSAKPASPGAPAPGK